MTEHPRHFGQALLFLGGAWREGAAVSPLKDKFSGDHLADVHEASSEHVHAALTGLARGERTAALPPHKRADILLEAARLLDQRRQEFEDRIIADAGFARSDAANEVSRAIDTLALSGEEARRIHGEVVPLDGYAAGAGRAALTLRVPVGVVCAITPFNSPLNTVAHKVGPALAAGNPVIVKPALSTPLSATALVGLLLDAGLPPELIALVHGEGPTVGESLLQSPVPAFYAFTGSTSVGAHIRRTIGLRKAQLELGGLSSTIVCADTDLDRAARLVTKAAFRKAGQVCTSVQRLYVERTVATEFERRVTRLLEQERPGDPWAAETSIGPLIDIREARRVEDWIKEAAAAGAEVVTGGHREQAVVTPTVLGEVPPTASVFSQEVFGPVLVIRPFEDLEAVFDEANATPYGLAAGLFTDRIDTAIRAAHRLEVGTVHINQTSSNRIDAMPYGGIKESGTGTEGPRYAIEEMTDQRLVTFGP